MKATQITCVADIKGIPIDEVCDTIEQLHESYRSFNSIMDILNWNSSMRGELKETIEQCKSPFGTSAEAAGQYLFDLTKEISRGDKLCQEKEKLDHYLQVIRGFYYSACYYIIVLQWLASLLCFFNSTSPQVCEHKETLEHIVQHKKDDIIQSYTYISEVIGHNVLQTLNIPFPESAYKDTNAPKPSSCARPLIKLFNVLLIKVLAVATLGPGLASPCSVDIGEATSCGSELIMVSASVMNMQLEAFRERVLSSDPLISQVIAALTDS